MLNVNTSIRDEATPALQQLAASVAGSRRKALMTTFGKTLEQELQEHFRKRNAEPNKRGWPKRNFWNRIRSSTSIVGASDTRATVTIADPAIKLIGNRFLGVAGVGR